jgi:DNA-binding NarL/FixJ family response regulator
MHTIIIIENHSIVSAGIRSLVEESKNFVVMETHDNGLDGLKALRQKKPTLAIVDLSLPKMNGVDVIRELFLENNPCKIIVLSRNDYITQVAELLRYNISGYVLKDNACEELLGALNIALDGGCFISHQIRNLLQKTGLIGEQSEKPLTVLTQREKQIIRMSWEGLNTAQLSQTLHISETTIRVHRKNIIKKLNITNFNDVARFKGLIFN